MHPLQFLSEMNCIELARPIASLLVQLCSCVHVDTNSTHTLFLHTNFQSEEKMQEKIKMTKQKVKDLVHVLQQCSVHFCKKKKENKSKAGPILTMTLLRSSTLSLLSMVKVFLL